MGNGCKRRQLIKPLISIALIVASYGALSGIQTAKFNNKDSAQLPFRDVAVVNIPRIEEKKPAPVSPLVKEVEAKKPLPQLDNQIEATAQPVAVPEPAPAPVTDVQGLAQQKAAARGWTGYEWTALHRLVTNESGWNAYAINSSSGACGLFQALPCSKYGAPLDNVSNQIDWGLSYIGSVYGSPSNALAMWLNRYPHWY